MDHVGFGYSSKDGASAKSGVTLDVWVCCAKTQSIFHFMEEYSEKAAGYETAWGSLITKTVTAPTANDPTYNLEYMLPHVPPRA